MELYVDLGAHSYSIYIENNILKDTGSYIEKVYSGKKIMIISDDNVFPLYGDTIVKTLEDEYEVHSLILPHGEPTKSFQSLPKIYSALLEARFSRSDLIIALGGGVIGDWQDLQPQASFAGSSLSRFRPHSGTSRFFRRWKSRRRSAGRQEPGRCILSAGSCAHRPTCIKYTARALHQRRYGRGHQIRLHLGC